MFLGRDRPVADERGEPAPKPGNGEIGGDGKGHGSSDGHDPLAPPCPGSPTTRGPQRFPRRKPDCRPAARPDITDVRQEGFCRIVTLLDPPLEAAPDDVRDGRGAIRPHASKRLRALVENGMDDPRVGPALERKLPREHLIDDDAERPEVGAGVHGPAYRLFRGHVSGRPGDAAAPGRLRPLGEPGDAEIHDAHPPLLRKHDIGALDIPVDDALAVGLFEALRDLGGDVERLPDRERPFADPVPQGPAGAEGHGDESLPLVFIDLVDGADVRMVETGGDLGFADEARPLGVGAEHPGPEELQGDGPLELRVLGLVNDAHPPLAQLARGERNERPIRRAEASGDPSPPGFPAVCS